MGAVLREGRFRDLSRGRDSVGTATREALRILCAVENAKIGHKLQRRQFPETKIQNLPFRLPNVSLIHDDIHIPELVFLSYHSDIFPAKVSSFFNVAYGCCKNVNSAIKEDCLLKNTTF